MSSARQADLPLAARLVIRCIREYRSYNDSGMRPYAQFSFDSETEIFQSWPIPSGEVYASIIRHMRPNADGDLLIHQSGTHQIMRMIVNGTGATQ